jgi:hypothetical protein
MAVEFCRVVPGRKHRVHQWINTETMEPLFGIQANIAYGKWAHVVADNKPLLFTTRAEAAEHAKVLSK